MAINLIVTYIHASSVVVLTIEASVPPTTKSVTTGVQSVISPSSAEAKNQLIIVGEMSSRLYCFEQRENCFVLNQSDFVM